MPIYRDVTNIKDIMNNSFGDYTLFDDETRISSDNRKLLHVICKCGSIDFKQERYLKIGRTTSCKSCSAKKTAKKFPPPILRTGFGDLSGTHYIAIRSGALRRGIRFDLSPEYLWRMFEKQKGKCALTNLDLTLNRSLKKQNVNWDVITASVDRINSDIGYVDGNVWWVHKEVNRLKNDYSLEELLYWCKLLVNRHGNPEPSTWNINK
mgnify:CR=1 FL=1